MIELRTIQRPHRRPNRSSVGTSRVSEFKRRQREERRTREEFTHAGGITHCSKCPPKRFRNDMLRFCPDCSRINAARHTAGLIRPPADQQVDHPNNIVDPTVSGSYRGQSRMLAYDHRRTRGAPVITAHLKQLGGGWRRGLASLNGRVIWEGPKTQSMDEAWAYAHEHVALIREGLAYDA